MRPGKQQRTHSLAALCWLYPWLIELWIASVLLVFFIIRVLGSGMGRRALSLLGLRHLQ